MKMLPIDVSLVIPVFNNEKTISKQLLHCERILKKTVRSYEIIIAEDKSLDNSKKVLQKFEDKKYFKIIYNKNNLGIAKNLFQLYKRASKKYIVLFSIDGDWNPNDISLLLTTIFKTKSDLVIGKRIKKNYSVVRSIISFSYNFLPILLFNTQTEDAGSIKVFKKSLFNTFPLVPTSVFFEAEMIIRAKKNNFTILSIPITSKKINKKEKIKDKVFLAIFAFRDLVILKYKGL